MNKLPINIKDKRLVLLIPAAGVVILIILLVMALSGRSRNTQAIEAAVIEGSAYIRSLETKDVASVENEIKALHRAKLLSQKGAMLEKIRQGEINVWDQFEDYVIFGDSRTQGFSYYGFLEEGRVLADRGATMHKVADYTEQLTALNPSSVFLCYGVNDILNGYWATADKTAEDIQKHVDEIHAICPDAVIYISSVLTVRNNAKLNDVTPYNEYIRAYCKQSGCIYIDNDAICSQYAGLWANDGIHVGRDFYRHWGLNMVEAIYNNILEAANE